MSDLVRWSPYAIAFLMGALTMDIAGYAGVHLVVGALLVVSLAYLYGQARGVESHE